MMFSAESRDKTLDTLRGIAVILMLFAHSVVFFNFNHNPFLKGLAQFGDTVVFTTFLFVSGAVSYLAYLSVANSEWRTKKKKLFLRSLKLLAIYYLIAFFANIKSFLLLPITSWPKNILEIFTFINVPSYSEFILPFVLYGLLILLFRPLLKRVVQSLFYSSLLGLVLFFVGTYLHQNVVYLPAGYYSSFLWGFSDWFRFPIFQYAPILLLGMNWVASTRKLGGVLKITRTLLMLLFWLFLLVGFNYGAYTPNAETAVLLPGIYLDRWPPSLQFLVVGLFFVFFVLLVVQLVRAIDQKGLAFGIFDFFGKNAISFYVVHILLLYTYRYTINQRIDNPLVFTGVFLLFLILCSLFVVGIRFMHKKYSLEKRAVGRFEQLLKRKSFVIVMCFALFVAFVFVFNFIASFTPVRFDANPFRDPEVEGIFIRTSDPTWWDSSFKFQRRLNIYNSAIDQSATIGSWVRFDIDHAELVNSKKSNVDGTDLRIVFFAGSDYRILPIELIDANTKEATISFPLIAEIPPLAADSFYFLYYGSDLAESILTNSASTIYDSAEVQLGDELEAKILVEMQRSWLLRGNAITDEQSKATFAVKTENFKLNTNDLIISINGRENKVLSSERVDDNNYYSIVDAQQLLPGKYSISAEVRGTEFISTPKEFFVSYPLYVTWTIDYEGFDVKNQYLDSMVAISEQYGMPITHLFNPRVYIASEISSERRRLLSDWLIDRYENHNDEIGLHLHMHYDLVRSIGLTPLTEPSWGGRVNGHDVLTSAYDYDSFSKMLVWSKARFEEYGLPVPKSYRGGGWFMDIDNLKALADNGFNIDTSGREFYIWGPNKQVGHWDLETTTKPYKPSTQNQNSDVPPPQIDIWQFPNNGLDSTNNSDAVLIKRFTDNYDGRPLKEPQTLTYLSHPHWFDTYDAPKMHALLKHISQYTFVTDSGPIVYVTLQDALKGWSNDTQ